MYRPFLQVRSNSLVTFDMWTGESSHTRYDFKQSERETYEGTLTPHARRRLLSCVDILIQRNPKRTIFNPISNTEHDFSINFITLTVSSQRKVDAREGYDLLLSKWLRYMRDKYDMREYVWKAELQNRGQIHYHIASNTFIPWQVIRWKWNKAQKEAGLLDNFARKHKHFNPNSVDIHAVEREEDVLGYISKEISKTSFEGVKNGQKVLNVYFDKKAQQYVGYLQPEPGSPLWVVGEWDSEGNCTSWPYDGYQLKEAQFDGKVWDASEALKRKRFIDEIDQDTFSRIGKAIREGQAREIEVERCKVIKSTNPIKLLSDDLVTKWREKIMN